MRLCAFPPPPRGSNVKRIISAHELSRSKGIAQGKDSQSGHPKREMVVGGRCWATACVILFLCVEEAAAFAVAPMGAGVALRRRHELRSTEATVSLQLLRTEGGE